MFDPIQRRQYGVFALFLSLVLFAVSGAAFALASINRQSVANEATAASAACETRMKLLGASSVQTTGDGFKATWPLEGGYEALSSASSAALACPGWTMSEFCMGQGCGTAGATLTLRISDGT